MPRAGCLVRVRVRLIRFGVRVGARVRVGVRMMFRVRVRVSATSG